MNIRLQFLGAARGVTGSRYLLETNGLRILVDCGYYQERQFRDRNYEPFQVEPETIDVMLLTHAHLDHCGLIPKLVKDGFRGVIHSTAATAEIARIVMLDSAKIQVEDARYKQKRHQKEGRKGAHPYEPLYTVEDAENAVGLFQSQGFEKVLQLAPGVEATFYEAGHILGASSIVFKITQDGENRTLLFSGDIGRSDVPLLRNPHQFDNADYVITESTYGDRNHKDAGDIHNQLADVINDAHRRGGNVIIPSFAVERSQDLLYFMNDLLHEKRIPHTMVFLDSPMAVRVTEVFRKHPELFDQETRELLESGRHPCDFPGLSMSRTAEQSKAINKIRGTIIIVAGSGMCTGGRIKHHLVSNISRPESTILFVGYQAVGTLGRHILTRPEEVRIHGQKHPIRAKISQIHGFSGHADREELIAWISALKVKPRRVFVTHGEEEVAQKYAQSLQDELGMDAYAPEYEEAFNLD